MQNDIFSSKFIGKPAAELILIYVEKIPLNWGKNLI